MRKKFEYSAKHKKVMKMLRVMKKQLHKSLDVLYKLIESASIEKPERKKHKQKKVKG